MAKKRSQPQDEPSSSRDINPVLRGWDYEPGTINVRKVIGLDGFPKIQMRLDLGLLQMEVNGRPDGARPYGCDSLLDYFEKQLKDHQTRNGTELGFHLTPSQCQSLRDEAAMYYHRYLSLFVLGDYRGVVRDTARNLRVIELCGQFADEEQDRLVLEQYRPYILMMNARARATIQLRRKNYRRALAIVRRALLRMKKFFIRFGHEEAYKQSAEARLLRRFARDIRQRLPVDPMRQLQKRLAEAVQREHYEEAARLRDEISRRGGQVGT
jgi:hypothetical protein